MVVWDRGPPLLAASGALMLGGIILSIAASPPVATRIGLDPLFIKTHVLFLLLLHIVLIAVSFLSHTQNRRNALYRVHGFDRDDLRSCDRPEVKVRGRGRSPRIFSMASNYRLRIRQSPPFVVLAAWLVAESAAGGRKCRNVDGAHDVLMLVSMLVMEPDFTARPCGS